MSYHFVGDDAFGLITWLMTFLPSITGNHIQPHVVSFPSCCGEYPSNAVSQVPLFLDNDATAPLQPGYHVPHVASTIPDVDHEDPATRALIPGSWREGRDMQGLMPLSGHNTQKKAKDQREYLSHCCMSASGAVPWQERMMAP